MLHKLVNNILVLLFSYCALIPTCFSLFYFLNSPKPKWFTKCALSRGKCKHIFNKYQPDHHNTHVQPLYCSSPFLFYHQHFDQHFDLHIVPPTTTSQKQKHVFTLSIVVILCTELKYLEQNT